jgi:hypothetical protein
VLFTVPFPSKGDSAVVIWSPGRPAGNTAVVSMSYRGNGTCYLATAVGSRFMTPALGPQVAKTFHGEQV